MRTDVADDGRSRVVLKNSEPVVAIVPIPTMECLSQIDEIEEDLRMIAITLARTATDSGARHDLADVAAEFGIDLDADD